MYLRLILLHLATSMAFLFWTACNTEKTELPGVETMEVTEIGVYTAKSGGKIDSDRGGTITERGLIWARNPDFNIENFEGQQVTGAGAGVFYVQITGLAPGTNYYVKAYAINEVGTAYGEAVEFVTLATAASVETADISGITSESAVGGGEVHHDGGADVIARGVVWGTSPNPQLSSGSIDFSTDGTGLGSFASQISGLSPGTSYYVRAYATNITGTVYGAQKSFRSAAVLPVVEMTGVDNITHASASLNGLVSYDGGDAITDRGFVYSTQPDPDMSASSVSAGSGGGEYSSSIGGLEASTTYYVRPYATNSIGTSLGEQDTFETDSEPINDGDPCPDIPTVTDTRDNQVYNTVYIGGQCWLKEPMRWLPEVHHPHDGSNTEPRYYVNNYFGTDLNEALATNNYINYGALYNHPAATEACPPGWHLSSDSEWAMLIDYLVNNYEEVQTSNVSNALKSRRQVNSPLGAPWATEEHPRWNAHEVQYGLDLVGFAAYPTGMRMIPPPGLPDLYFSLPGSSTYLWTSTPSPSFVWTRTLSSGSGMIGRSDLYREYGFAVRCVRSAQ
jgi:uncharacterized protein (TIGR02145 family)